MLPITTASITAPPKDNQLIILLDYESFSLQRDKDRISPLLIEHITHTLAKYFDVTVACAYYTNQVKISDENFIFAGIPFEAKSIDALLPQPPYKNSIDVCIAMDAVRFAMQQPKAHFAIIVGVNKDYSTTAAYLRRCLHKKVIAFASDSSPSPYLAQEVNLYLSHQSTYLWERQIYSWLTRKDTPTQQSLLQDLLALIEDLQLPASCPISIIEEQLNIKNCDQKLLSLGCTLSENRRWILRWGNRIQESIDQTRDPFTNLQLSPKPYGELQGVIETLLKAFKFLIPLEFPMPITLLQDAIRQSNASIPYAFNKHKLSTLLKLLDFELSDNLSTILKPTSTNAIAICEQAKLPIQTTLF